MNAAVNSPAQKQTGKLHACFLGSILLEPRRWQRDRPPGIRLADWVERIRAAGFKGIEIWEPHWTHATEEERRRMQAAGLRFIFNSYASLDSSGQAARETATAAATALHAEGIKFNFGKDAQNLADERAVANHWAGTLPPACRLLCECHADTLAETPSSAAKLAHGWDPARIGFIVHPFSAGNLAAWIEALPERIVHLHIQMRAADNTHRFVALVQRSSLAASRWRLLADAWPGGTATIEFTAGVGARDDDTAALLASACADAALLCALDAFRPATKEVTS